MNREKHDIGLVGLEVMGQNLVLNMAGQGHRVAVYNRTAEVTERFIAERVQGKRISRSRRSSRCWSGRAGLRVLEGRIQGHDLSDGAC